MCLNIHTDGLTRVFFVNLKEGPWHQLLGFLGFQGYIHGILLLSLLENQRKPKLSYFSSKLSIELKSVERCL